MNARENLLRHFREEPLLNNITKNVLIGKSFTTALNNDIDNIQISGTYDFIELPCGAPYELYKQINRCIQCNKVFALHYPSHYTVEKVGKTILENTEKVLSDITQYITKYSECLYMVIHFPFEPFFEKNPDEEEKVRIIFNMFSNSLEKYSEKILVENLSFHRYCNTGKQFDLIWRTSKTSLNMCLDIGHTFLVDGMNGIYSFFNEMKNEIIAIHLYNTTRNRQSEIYGKHLSLQNKIGEIDINEIWSYLNSLPNLRFVIDEAIYGY